jgi:hypothetical protein
MELKIATRVYNNIYIKIILFNMLNTGKTEAKLR